VQTGIQESCKALEATLLAHSPAGECTAGKRSLHDSRGNLSIGFLTLCLVDNEVHAIRAIIRGFPRI
jgi:hypothetical protein